MHAPELWRFAQSEQSRIIVADRAAFTKLFDSNFCRRVNSIVFGHLEKRCSLSCFCQEVDSWDLLISTTTTALRPSRGVPACTPIPQKSHTAYPSAEAISDQSQPHPYPYRSAAGQKIMSLLRLARPQTRGCPFGFVAYHALPSCSRVVALDAKPLKP
jgi:hypothetical protein